MNIWKKEPSTGKTGGKRLNVELSELNLSARSYNCLKRAGCSTLGDILVLIAMDKNGLRRIRNLGSRSEAEILERVRKYTGDPVASGNGQERLSS